MALFSAYANDDGYGFVFAQQLANMVQRKEVVTAISTSGESLNVVAATRLVRRAGAVTNGFTGYPGGGELLRIADITVRVPTGHIEYVEDAHLIIEHMITARLRDGARPSSSRTGHPFSD